MTRYVVQRVLQMIPVLLIVTMISFSLMYLLPGDPVLMLLGEDLAGDKELYEAMYHQMGLDRPFYVQYLDWLVHALRGDFGLSARTSMPVAEGLLLRLPATIELSLLALTLSLLIAVPAGILSAAKPNSFIDRIFSVGALFGVAIPHFWLAILLILLLAVTLQLLPTSGYVPFFEDPIGNLKHMILPAITLGLGAAAVLMRQIRSALIEVLQSDYITTSRAKGLRESLVILRHGLKNALIPVVTVLGIHIGRLVGGAVITESIFMVPGIGRWAVDSITWRDFPVVQTVCLVMAAAVLVTNLLSDISYALIDPRIRYD